MLLHARLRAEFPRRRVLSGSGAGGGPMLRMLGDGWAPNKPYFIGVKVSLPWTAKMETGDAVVARSKVGYDAGAAEVPRPLLRVDLKHSGHLLVAPNVPLGTMSSSGHPSA